MATAAQDASNFESSLRDRLIAAQSVSQPLEDPSQVQDHQSHIDPSIEGPLSPGGQRQPDDYTMGGILDEDLGGVPAAGSKTGQARRELSGTKRAAQNRAAQRAFRQRKEQYITKLEKQVKDFRAVEDDLRVVQHENYQLREYILVLQTRILETSNELPPPPPQVHIPHPTEAAAMRLADERDGHEPHPLTNPTPPKDDIGSVPTASMLAGVVDEQRQIDDALPRDAVQQLRAAAAGVPELEVDERTMHPDLKGEE